MFSKPLAPICWFICAIALSSWKIASFISASAARWIGTASPGCLSSNARAARDSASFEALSRHTISGSTSIWRVPNSHSCVASLSSPSEALSSSAASCCICLISPSTGFSAAAADNSRVCSSTFSWRCERCSALDTACCIAACVAFAFAPSMNSRALSRPCASSVNVCSASRPD